MDPDTGFLADHMARPWAPETRHGLQPAGLFLGNGAHAIEIAVAQCGAVPTRTALVETWKHRRGGRAAPVLLIALHSEGAALCGASGEEPPVYPRADTGQVERLCREVLDQPDRHSALRFLAQVLPSLETALPGLNNEGLLAMHELEHGAPDRPDWGEARRKAAVAVGKREESLLGALGFQVERLDNLTSLLRGGDRRIALAVMLRESESPEAGTQRFNSLSPVSYALAKADSENLPWVLLVQANRLRLYSTDMDAGVGRRGRTETFIECQPSLLSDQHLPYLWLLYSAEALAPDGSLREILSKSHRFAGSLAERLRERIYDEVVPVLAQGIAEARDLKAPGPAEPERTYEMALTVLFRLLFIAYAEDRDLLPYRFNESYRRRSLKQKAQELADCVARATPIADGSSHWQETALLWDAVANGNRKWSVPAYDGGLFTSDPQVSRAGAGLAGIVVPNAAFEEALRGLLVIETAEGVPGPVDFRSLGVREFGTIYEGLLESDLALADTDFTLNKQGAYMPARKKDTVAVSRGEVYLHNRSGARKSSGSYYTKQFAVEHLLDGSLQPALEHHFKRLGEADDTDAAEAFFDFRVADIAMGSGHFLIAAIDRVEKGMADFLARRNLPGVRRELAGLREAALRELGELGEATTIEDGQLLRRLIARRCIYGVDLNALSVQLARLSVWIRKAPRLDLNVDRQWRARPDAELHATKRKPLMDLDSETCPDGYWPVYKGESFDLWSPDTGQYYAFADPEPVLELLQSTRLRSGKSKRDSAHREFPLRHLQDRATLPCFAPRVAFRDVSRATDSRTVRVALVPQEVFIANTGPYFLWPRGDERDQAYLLGVLSSIPLDWYARRYVENHVNYFIINPFPVPRPGRDDPLWQRAVVLAGRLACPDDRFTDWADAVGVVCGPVMEDEKVDMIHELDAVVARLYGLTEAQLIHVFETFHEGWEHQERLDGVFQHFRRWHAR